MSVTDITAISSITATVIMAIALFITVYHFKKQLQLTFFAEYTKRYQEIILNFPENINEENFDFDSLTPETRAKTLRYMRAYFDLCSEEYYLYKANNLDKATWKEWESGIKFALSKVAFTAAWNQLQFDTIYYPSFSEFVKETINQD